MDWTKIDFNPFTEQTLNTSKDTSPALPLKKSNLALAYLAMIPEEDSDACSDRESSDDIMPSTQFKFNDKPRNSRSRRRKNAKKRRKT